MKEIKLSKGLVALVDDSDFEFLNQWKWYASKYENTFYAKRATYPNGAKGKKNYTYMHKLLLPSDGVKSFTDHADRNGLNNQMHNLRIATKSQNAKNSRSRVNSTSKYLGVCWVTSRHAWIATIKVDGKQIYGGQHQTEKSAAIWYNKMARKHHGEFANLNLITQ